MDVHALFDKLLTDLADRGVAEGRDDMGARLLVADGVPFARLGQDERMAFRAVGPVPDDAGTTDGAEVTQVTAGAAQLPRAQRVGGWVVVPADDVSRWESLARDALSGVIGAR